MKEKLPVCLNERLTIHCIIWYGISLWLDLCHVKIRNIAWDVNERKWKRNGLCKKSFFVILLQEKDCTWLAKIWLRRWKNTSAFHGLIFNFAHKSEVMDYPHPLNTTYIRSWWTNARWWQYFKYCSNPKIHYCLFLSMLLVSSKNRPIIIIIHKHLRY